MAEVEQAILQGIDIKPDSSYREDRRADSPEMNTDDELGSDLESTPEDEGLYDRDDDDDDDGRGNDAAITGLQEKSSSGRMKGLLASKTAARGEEGATNTGPKGVLRDQRLRAEQERQSRIAGVQAVNSRMEKQALSSESYSQQVEREKREARARLRADNADSDNEDAQEVSKTAIADLKAKEQRRAQRLAELQSSKLTGTGLQTDTANNSAAAATNNRWFGHLREVDERGYVSAIDNEDSSVPVIIHIYSKAVEACNVLTHSLSSLARLYPRTKFLQVQASAIGFGTSTQASIDEEEYDDAESRALVVLPTLLVYKQGTLVANLVRVDLEDDWTSGEEQGIRTILDRYKALV